MRLGTLLDPANLGADGICRETDGSVLMIVLDACLDVVHSVEVSLRRHGVGQSGVDCEPRQNYVVMEETSIARRRLIISG